MATVDQLAIYFVQTFASLCLLILLVRLLLRLCRANFYNPLSQFVFKSTEPVLAPLRRIAPAFKRFDTATLLLILLLQWLAIQATLAIAGVDAAPILLPLVWAALGAVSMLLNIYFYGILAVIILSWVAPASQHPMTALLYELIEPVMAPFRRIIPSFGGIDLSPILIFLAINLLRMLLAELAAATQLMPGIVPGI